MRISDWSSDVCSSDLDGGTLKLLHFAYRSEVDIRPAPLEDFVAVHLPVRGTLAYSCNGRGYRVGPGSGVAISPRDDVRMRWSEDLELRVLRVDQIGRAHV